MSNVILHHHTSHSDPLPTPTQIHIPFPSLDCREGLWQKCIMGKAAFLADHGVQGGAYDWAALATLALSAADIQEVCVGGRLRFKEVWTSLPGGGRGE